METTVSLDNVLDFINLMSLSHQHKRWLDGVAGHIRRVGVKHCCISKITIAELLYGTAWGGHKENRKEVGVIAKLFDVIPISSSLSVFAEMKASLRYKGIPIDNFDLLIGASALQNHCVMATDKISHFNHIPNIKIENWVQR
ncbi:PIN domain-containing protein [Hoylesella pleuritidis]|uniref:PIN domain-containing protein n=1 Tax=Hoylesella pleuritidis TaxID=407975 RepID=UPI0028E75E81|nr:PIN domain-containing protein [Hoylesella pleuritidis]